MAQTINAETVAAQIARQLELPIGTEKLLTKKGLGTKLGVTPRSIDRYLADNKMPSEAKVVMGKAVRFRETVIDSWIAAGCPETD